MRKEKFVYNTKTLRYEKEVVPVKVKLLRVSGILMAIFLAAIVVVTIRINFYSSPKELALQRELDQMGYKYASLTNEVDMMTKVLDNIQERDASVHRMM
ncbi:MAG: M23 family peptidase, partial [Saprospiraceae bacterium]|nr:M23 family peptidase [Saprospiraceae bacterium]